MALAGVGYGQSAEALARTLRTKPTVPGRTALQKFAQAHAKDQAGAVAQLALAVHDIESKVPERAVTSLRQLEKRLPQLRDYLHFFLAQALADSGQYREVVKVATEVTASPVETRAVALAVRAYVELGEADKAVALVRDRYARLDQPAAEALLGNALDAAGQGAAAAQAWTHLYVAHPKTSDGAAARTALLRAGIALTARQRLERAHRLFELNDNTEARTEYLAAMNELTGPDRDLARVRVGATHYRAKEYAAALRVLREATAAAPETDAERLYWLTEAARKAKETSLMEETAASIRRLYPATRWATEALVSVGNSLLASEQYPESQKYFALCAETQSNSNSLPYCHWKVAYQAYADRRPDAYQQLNAFAERFPTANQTSAAWYFLGRLAETQKNSAVARNFYTRVAEQFPNYYYAMLARERGGVTGRVPDAQRLSFEPTSDLKLRQERAGLLATAGLDDYAERELRYAGRQGVPAHQLAFTLAKLTDRRGEPDRAMRFIKGIFPGYLSVPIEGAPKEFWRLVYPLPYREDVERFARSQNLDPYLVAGLIRQESEFNPRALSRTKAQGLMQVMPATGREISRKLGIKGFTLAMLYKPEISLQMGTYHFRKWLDAEDGQVEVTLSAYNAGKTRADRWQKYGPFREPAEFVEIIPFLETRDYVQAVMRNADMYRRLYGPAGKASSLAAAN
jgi:soluble lytic murein transglycosylase